MVITTNINSSKSFFDEIKDDIPESTIDENAIYVPEEKSEILDEKTLEKINKKEKEDQKRKIKRKKKNSKLWQKGERFGKRLSRI